jgi:phosphate-selective porin OprO/OprP
LTSRLHLDVGGYNYALVYDFGGSSDGFGGLASGSLPGGGTSGIENAWLSYSGFKPFVIEGGYMDVPYTLDEATSSTDIMFMERSSSSIIATNIAAGDFRSADGSRAYNDWIWAGGYLTGPTSGQMHSDTTTVTKAPQLPGITTFGFSEQYGSAARLTMQALQGPGYSIHVGDDAEFLFRPPVGPATSTAPGTRTLTLSDRPELRIDQGDPDHRGDGQCRAYGGIIPSNPVNMQGTGWGAWEIAARYRVVNLNDLLDTAVGVAGGEQTIHTAGLNWYVNRNIRFMVNYLHGTVEKQESSTSTVNTGANFDAVAGRMQVAF